MDSYLKLTKEEKIKFIFDNLKEQHIGCMLAQDYHKHSAKVVWGTGVWAQPKLDGQRCLAIVKNGKVTLMSRAGKEITTMDHIKKAIEKNFKSTANFVADGELYAHGLSFQENMRLIKKFREGESNHVTYHIYDMVSTKPFKERMESVQAIVAIVDSPYVTEVGTVPVSMALLPKIHGANLGNGYEGTMIRHSQEGYEINARSYSLLKYKDFKDLDAEIVDVIPSEARPEQGIVVCKYNGKTFKANPKMSHKEREELLKNKKHYIGQTANIRYFELSEDGIPRFPVFIGIHNDR